MTVTPVEDGYTVTLENRSDYIVFQNILKALDKDGNLAVPVYWSDNFFPLPPHEKRTVSCKTDQKGLNIIVEN
jgi:hypothetical protein